MQCIRSVPLQTISWNHPRQRQLQCHCSAKGADSSVDHQVHCTTPTPAATTSHASHQQQQQNTGRRAALLAAAVLPALVPALPTRASASSDLVEGTQNLLNISRNSLGLWVQKGIDSVVNGDETGITDLDNLDGTPRKRRFGSVSVPGLSSFSFIHGALVGGAVILLLAADKLNPQQQSQQAGDQQHPVLNPEVEAALKQLLASPEVKAQFHDPAVHAALQEVRVDPRAIAKYRDDPVVMQAFSKLLEIENILERL